jgi:hypothetical protein
MDQATVHDDCLAEKPKYPLFYPAVGSAMLLALRRVIQRPCFDHFPSHTVLVLQNALRMFGIEKDYGLTGLQRIHDTIDLLRLGRLVTIVRTLTTHKIRHQVV